jgi:hypothetical protein
MGKGKERRKSVTTGIEEVGQINTRKEERLAGTSTAQQIGRCNPGKQGRRWLDVC